MTSKLEQVAEAMWQAEWTRGGSGGKRRVPWSDIAPVDQERWRFIARAAIAAMEVPTEQSVSEIPDAELLSRAVNAARKRSARKGEKHPRWVAVMDAFQLGSGYAGELCRRFDLSPDEEVSR